MKNFFLLLSVVLCGCSGGMTVIDAPTGPVSSSATSSVSSAMPRSSAVSSATVTVVSSAAPKALRISVPFMVQAPFANWDELHEETCEEASVIMVQRFWEGKKTITSQEAEDELQRLVAWMTQQGYGYDVTMTQMLDVAKRFYGLNGTVETHVTAERIREILREGRPIVLPVAGREIGNPYFSGEGPYYHVLTIVGYDGDELITHDPGTKRGEYYRYDADVLLAANHDWTGVKEETNTGPKTMLVLWK